MSSMAAHLSPGTRSPNAVSALVDQAISLLEIFDRDLVEEFLIRRGVRFTVVVRALGVLGGLGNIGWTENADIKAAQRGHR